MKFQLTCSYETWMIPQDRNSHRFQLTYPYRIRYKPAASNAFLSFQFTYLYLAWFFYYITTRLLWVLNLHYSAEILLVSPNTALCIISFNSRPPYRKCDFQIWFPCSFVNKFSTHILIVWFSLFNPSRFAVLFQFIYLHKVWVGRRNTAQCIHGFSIHIPI